MTEEKIDTALKCSASKAFRGFVVVRIVAAAALLPAGKLGCRAIFCIKK
jgi:hypothetical protein